MAGAGGAPGAGAAISLRATAANSKWLGTICPKCGNTLAEGDVVVLCPKCYTPQHGQCWRDNGDQCAVDQTAARIIERPNGPRLTGAAAAPAASAALAGPSGAPPASPASDSPMGGPPDVRLSQTQEAPDSDNTVPTSPTPTPPTPSADSSPAAQGQPGVSAQPERAGAVRPEAAPAAPAPRPAAAAAARPAPPRPVPGAAAGGARPAARGAAGPSVREAPGLRPMATVREALEKALEGLGPEFGTSVDEVSVTVPPDQVQEVARRAKYDERLQFDYLRCLSGVDYQAEGIEVVYHLFSTRLLQKCSIKARVPGEGGALPTVTPVWAGADWHEREAAEMFNIRFDGHPKLEPLLLQKDEEGRVVPGPILLKRFPLRPKEPPGIYGFPEEE